MDPPYFSKAEIPTSGYCQSHCVYIYVDYAGLSSLFPIKLYITSDNQHLRSFRELRFSLLP